MLSYLRTRICSLLVGALVRTLTPEMLARPTTDAPPPPPPAAPVTAIPASARVARAVLAARAMVQAANALATAGEDVPAGMQLYTEYADRLLVYMRLDFIELQGEEVEDD